MPCLIDTNVAIHIRDRHPLVLGQVEKLDQALLVSVVTRVELEGGVYSKPELAAQRRAALDIFLTIIETVSFDDAAANAYRTIVADLGFSRRLIGDRMIAATALTHGLPLITMNGDDFRDVPGLSLTVWPSPAD